MTTTIFRDTTEDALCIYNGHVPLLVHGCEGKYEILRT